MPAAAVALAVTLLAAAPAADAEASARGEALTRAAFPDADRVEAHDLVLDDATARRLEDLAHARVADRHVTFFTARHGGAVVGHLAVHAHVVRTKRETLAVAFEPDGRIRKIQVLSFLEPPEYRPPERWLAQLEGKGAGDRLVAGQDVPAISGATLTARGVTDSARWLLQALKLAAGEGAR